MRHETSSPQPDIPLKTLEAIEVQLNMSSPLWQQSKAVSKVNWNLVWWFRHECTSTCLFTVTLMNWRTELSLKSLSTFCWLSRQTDTTATLVLDLTEWFKEINKISITQIGATVSKMLTIVNLLLFHIISYISLQDTDILSTILLSHQVNLIISCNSRIHISSDCRVCCQTLS